MDKRIAVVFIDFGNNSHLLSPQWHVLELYHNAKMLNNVWRLTALYIVHLYSYIHVEHIASLYFSVTSRGQWEGEETLGGCTAGEKDWDRFVKKVLKGENGNERDWDRKNRMRKGKEQRDWNEHSFSNRRHQSPQINPFFQITILSSSFSQEKVFAAKSAGILSKDWNTHITDICPWALARAKREGVATCLGKPHLHRDRQVTRTQRKFIYESC